MAPLDDGVGEMGRADDDGADLATPDPRPVEDAGQRLETPEVTSLVVGALTAASTSRPLPS